MNFMKILTALTIIVLVVFACSSAPKEQKKADGKTLFTENCSTCHGDDGKAGVMGAADLSRSALDKNSMYGIIKGGKGAMTGFSAVLSEEQVYSVIEYVNTLRSK